MPWPETEPTAAHRAAYADAEPRPFWRCAADVAPALDAGIETDLCIVGAGFTGLWAALLAKADDPARDVVVLEAETAGFGASGRNGGFAVASLTHGLSNGLARFAGEMPVLERLARENLAGLQADLESHGIDCDFEPTGELTALTEPHEVAAMEDDAAQLRRFGHEVTLFDGPAMRAEIGSPTYLGGIWDRSGAAILDPGKLAAGLRAAAVALGVRLYEHSPVQVLRPGELLTPSGRVRARRTLLATSAFPPLLRALGRYVVPVYDYVLVTEPLGARRGEIAWRRRQGIGDAGNQFHYYRLTADDRILWGGYDAIYRFRGPVAPRPGRARADVRQALPALLPHVPAARGRAVHAPVGRRDRHVQPLLGVLRHGAPGPARLRRRLHRARRRLRRGSARGSRSTCWTAARPRRRGCATCAPSRCRSRPSRCAGRPSSSPATGWPRPTATPAGAACGSGRSTGSGWGSTPEHGREVGPQRGLERPVARQRPEHERAVVGHVQRAGERGVAHPLRQLRQEARGVRGRDGAELRVGRRRARAAPSWCANARRSSTPPASATSASTGSPGASRASAAACRAAASSSARLEPKRSASVDGASPASRATSASVSRATPCADTARSAADRTSASVRVRGRAITESPFGNVPRMPDLSGTVALVAGATRGGGRGIAVELGARRRHRLRDRPQQPRHRRLRHGPPGDDRGDRRAAPAAIPVRVDHARPDEVRALVDRIAREQDGRLDLLVNGVWGGDPLTDWEHPLWEQDLDTGLRLLRQAVETHIVTSRFALPLLVARRRGLVVEVTDGNTARYRGSFFYDIAKATVIRLAQAQAAELAPHGVTAVALTPGFLRSEAVLRAPRRDRGHVARRARPALRPVGDPALPRPRGRRAGGRPGRGPATPAARCPPARWPASTASPTSTAPSPTSTPTGGPRSKPSTARWAIRSSGSSRRRRCAPCAPCR